VSTELIQGAKYRVIVDNDPHFFHRFAVGQVVECIDAESGLFKCDNGFWAQYLLPQHYEAIE
jgi:hypothetical protein